MGSHHGTFRTCVSRGGALSELTNNGCCWTNRPRVIDRGRLARVVPCTMEWMGCKASVIYQLIDGHPHFDANRIASTCPCAHGRSSRERLVPVGERNVIELEE